MPLVSGATAAGFSIVRQLEHADFGEVYVAEHPRLPRLQFLYLIPAEISVDLDYRDDFNQETAVAATLWHPNILGLTDRGEFEDQLWISTDHLDGRDAAQVLGDKHPDGMPPKMVVEIVAAMAEALDCAHDQGVLHHHVNPGIILVGKGPADKRRIALSGFGVTRPSRDKGNTLTRPDLFIGTASYTAPERLLDDAVDGRADQYGLAASAFHLLTGTPPFAHFNHTVLVTKQLDEPPPRPSDIKPHLIEFDAIFARALALPPADRFRRCREFARALESISGGAPSRSHGTPDIVTPPETQEADATAVLAAPTSNSVALTEPAPLAPAVRPAVAEPGAPALAPPPGRARYADSVGDDEIDDVERDDDETAARSRRRKQTAAIAGTILVVLVAWFAGVKALRSASHSDDAPSSIETTTAEPTAVIEAPPPVPLPAPRPPAPVMAPPPLSGVTTTAPTKTKAAPVTTTTAAQPSNATTTASKPATTKPGALDTRPAPGMPCGPDQNGAPAVSNTGGPVNCVSTPGGFAWEPPGFSPGS